MRDSSRCRRAHSPLSLLSTRQSYMRSSLSIPSDPEGAERKKVKKSVQLRRVEHKPGECESLQDTYRFPYRCLCAGRGRSDTSKPCKKRNSYRACSCPRATAPSRSSSLRAAASWAGRQQSSASSSASSSVRTHERYSVHQDECKHNGTLNLSQERPEATVQRPSRTTQSAPTSTTEEFAGTDWRSEETLHRSPLITRAVYS